MHRPPDSSAQISLYCPCHTRLWSYARGFDIPSCIGILQHVLHSVEKNPIQMIFLNSCNSNSGKFFINSIRIILDPKKCYHKSYLQSQTGLCSKSKESSCKSLITMRKPNFVYPSPCRLSTHNASRFPLSAVSHDALRYVVS